jgi:leucyl-tRNA synthetase
MKFKINFDANADVESIKKDLIKDDRLEKFLNQREIKKIIVVPGKIINIVC